MRHSVQPAEPERLKDLAGRCVIIVLFVGSSYRLCVLKSICSLLQELLLAHAETANPFTFGEYDAIDPGDSPSGPGLLAQRDFIVQLLEVIPRAEVNASQIQAMLQFAVARMVQRFDVSHKA